MTTESACPRVARLERAYHAPTFDSRELLSSLQDLHLSDHRNDIPEPFKRLPLCLLPHGSIKGDGSAELARLYFSPLDSNLRIRVAKAGVAQSRPVLYATTSLEGEAAVAMPPIELRAAILAGVESARTVGEWKEGAIVGGAVSHLDELAIDLYLLGSLGCDPVVVRAAHSALLMAPVGERHAATELLTSSPNRVNLVHALSRCGQSIPTSAITGPVVKGITALLKAPCGVPDLEPFLSRLSGPARRYWSFGLDTDPSVNPLLLVLEQLDQRYGFELMATNGPEWRHLLPLHPDRSAAPVSKICGRALARKRVAP